LESVEAGSNAYRVGLRAGDYILKVSQDVWIGSLYGMYCGYFKC